MPPIRQGNGTGISDVRLGDGTQIGEVRKGDGTVLWSSGPDIPDSGNLQARYDARNLSLSDGATVSSWPDESGNGNDLSLSTGSPTYRSSGTAGLPSVEFTDTGDRLQTSFGQSITEPYSVWFLGNITNRNTGVEQIAWSDNPVPASGFVGFEVDQGGNYEWKINGSTDPVLGTNDINDHVFANQFNAGDGTLRVDGTDIATAFADSGSNDLDGIALGYRPDGNSPANLQIVEVLVYTSDESNYKSEIESHLDRDSTLI